MTSSKKLNPKDEVEAIRSLADVNESYLVGLMWANPIENYSLYGEKMESKDFLHKQWGFYFGLGKKLYQKGLKVFDDISVNATVMEFGTKDLFDKFGGLETMYELVNIVKENDENVDAYFESLLKNKVIMALMEFLGNNVINTTKTYNYKEMTATQISSYWQDKMNQIAVSSISQYEDENLYIEPDKFIQNLKDEKGNMMPYYSSGILGNMVQGIPRGEVTMIGGFGNSGKSSFMVDKVLMSCIHDVDKTLVVLNEEGADKLREKLLLSLINHEMRTTKGAKETFARWKFNKVDELTDSDIDLIKRTFAKWNELTEGDDAHIKVVFMEQYRIADLRNIVALHANRGYVNLIIDTHKVPDAYTQSARWEAIVEGTKEIYKMTRKESGGFNLRTVLTIQLADSHIGDRFLGYDAIGEGKAMKNEASVLLMYRPLFADEYDKIEPKRMVKSDLSGGKWVQENVILDKNKTYYVMFIPKNRFGGNTDSGQDCILYEPNFDFNSFREVGTVKIDRNYA